MQEDQCRLVRVDAAEPDALRDTSNGNGFHCGDAVWDYETVGISEILRTNTTYNHAQLDEADEQRNGCYQGSHEQLPCKGEEFHWLHAFKHS